MEAPLPAPIPEEPAPTVEEPAPAPTLSGHVEAGYHLSLSGTSTAHSPVPLRSYDAANNTFMLHAAHLALNHSFSDNVSATVEIDAGSDAALTASAPLGGGLFDVQEAYATYADSGFSFTAGKFATYAGIEVIEGPLNPTLTRGYLYGMAEAYTHTGLKAGYTSDGGVSFSLGVVNGWDVIIDNNDWKTIIWRLGYASDTFFGGFSGSYGAEDPADDQGRLSLDLTGGVIMDDLTLNFQANFGMQSDAVDTDGDMEGDESDNWWGLGVQPVYTSGQFSFGGRLELFANKYGTRTLVLAPIEDGMYLNISLTPGVTLAEHFVARFEYRMDIAVGGDPTKDVLGKASDPKSMQHTIGLGASYSF